jgi:hypothetical protein
MSTRSYVGVLDPDGRSYRARYVHFDGAPDTMPYLIAAGWWHTFGQDDAATVAALLAHDWEQVGPDLTAQTPPSMPGYQPVPGVGMAMPPDNTQLRPVTGLLSDPMPDGPLQWMYLIDSSRPGTLLICANTGRWTVTGRVDLAIGRDVVIAPD